MKLSINQAKELLKNPINSILISEGRKYESRLRLYTETKFKNELSKEFAWNEFVLYLQTILSKSKYEKIKDFIKYPLSSVDITENCLNDIYKIFDARNSYFHNDFDKIENNNVISNYLNENDILNWFVENGKAVLKNKPNSIIVIDKNKEGKPYLLLVDSKRLYDFQLKTDSELEYIIFEHSKEKINGEIITNYSVYDDVYYRVFQEINGEYFLKEGYEIKHNAKSCPARMFLNDKLNEENDYNRKNPFSNAISKLEEWQIFDIYKFYADHYSAFPVIEAPADNCGVDACIKGFIHNEDTYNDGEVIKTRTVYTPCEVCKSKDLIGPGTTIRVQPKEDKDDPSESGIFRFISNPTENLEYIKNKLTEIETSIISNVTGKQANLESGKQQAFNEKQVKNSVEAKQNILVDLKLNFDLAYKWTIEKIIELINPNVKVNVNVNFGTEFYLLSESDLQALFENAQKIGIPDAEIDMIYNQLIETKYKGNIKKISRLKLIKKLDILPYKNTDQAILLFDKNIISKKDLIFKIGLVKFVEKFEDEYSSIIDFGIELEPKKRIDKIKGIINKYINDEQNTSE